MHSACATHACDTLALSRTWARQTTRTLNTRKSGIATAPHRARVLNHSPLPRLLFSRVPARSLVLENLETMRDGGESSKPSERYVASPSIAPSPARTPQAGTATPDARLPARDSPRSNAYVEAGDEAGAPPIGAVLENGLASEHEIGSSNHLVESGATLTLIGDRASVPNLSPDLTAAPATPSGLGAADSPTRDDSVLQGSRNLSEDGLGLVSEAVGGWGAAAGATENGNEDGKGEKDGLMDFSAAVEQADFADFSNTAGGGPGVGGGADDHFAGLLDFGISSPKKDKGQSGSGGGAGEADPGAPELPKQSTPSAVHGSDRGAALNDDIFGLHLGGGGWPAGPGAAAREEGAGSVSVGVSGASGSVTLGAAGEDPARGRGDVEELAKEVVRAKEEKERVEWEVRGLKEEKEKVVREVARAKEEKEMVEGEVRGLKEEKAKLERELRELRADKERAESERREAEAEAARSTPVVQPEQGSSWADFGGDTSVGIEGGWSDFGDGAAGLGPTTQPNDVDAAVSPWPQAADVDMSTWPVLSERERSKCSAAFQGVYEQTGVRMEDARAMYDRALLPGQHFQQAFRLAADALPSRPATLSDARLDENSFALFMFCMKMVRGGHPLPATLSPEQRARILSGEGGSARAALSAPRAPSPATSLTAALPTPPPRPAREAITSPWRPYGEVDLPPHGLTPPGAHAGPGPRREREGEPSGGPSAEVAELVAMGFSSGAAEDAMRRFGSMEAALNWLVDGDPGTGAPALPPAQDARVMPGPSGGGMGGGGMSGGGMGGGGTSPGPAPAQAGQPPVPAPGGHGTAPAAPGGGNMMRVGPGSRLGVSLESLSCDPGKDGMSRPFVRLTAVDDQGRVIGGEGGQSSIGQQIDAATWEMRGEAIQVRAFSEAGG